MTARERIVPDAMTITEAHPLAPCKEPAMQRALPCPVPGRTYVPWGMLAAIDLHGCELAGSQIPNASARSSRR